MKKFITKIKDSIDKERRIFERLFAFGDDHKLQRLPIPDGYKWWYTEKSTDRLTLTVAAKELVNNLGSVYVSIEETHVLHVHSEEYMIRLQTNATTSEFVCISLKII